MKVTGDYNMEDYLKEYTDTVNQVRAVARFMHCHKERIRAGEMSLLNILLENMRNCMEINALSDARRHAGYARNILDRVFRTSN